MLIIAIAICVAVICVVVWMRTRSASRRNAIRRYADAHHFHYLESGLPATLKLDDSSFRLTKSISSAFAGTGSKSDFVFFDCFMPGDRMGYTQSVLALHHFDESYPACAFDRALRQERRGDWTLVFHDRREWSLAEIDAHISSI